MTTEPTTEATTPCATCGELDGVEGECPRSERPCGHHCNHVWTHDACCWCKAHYDGDRDGWYVPNDEVLRLRRAYNIAATQRDNLAENFVRLVLVAVRLRREADQDRALITALVLGEAPDNVAAMNASPHRQAYWRAIGVEVDDPPEEGT